MNRHRAVEDSQVELKAESPDPYDAARRVAGLANAAQTDPVLWLIRVDEKRGVVGADYRDLSDNDKQCAPEAQMSGPAAASGGLIP